MIKKFNSYNESVSIEEDYGEKFINDAIVVLEDVSGNNIIISKYISDAGFNRQNNITAKSGLFVGYRLSINIGKINDEDENEDYDEPPESFTSTLKVNDLIELMDEIKKFKIKLERYNFIFNSTVQLESSGGDTMRMMFDCYYNKQYLISDEIIEARESFNNFIKWFYTISNKYNSIGIHMTMTPSIINNSLIQSRENWVYFLVINSPETNPNSFRDFLRYHPKKEEKIKEFDTNKETDDIIEKAESMLNNFKITKVYGSEEEINDPIVNSYFGRRNTKALCAIFTPPKGYFDSQY
jgi:hypothetical protein